MKHTPTPWELYADSYIQGSDKKDVLKVIWTDERHDANAAFIVKACNAHDELFKAAQNVLEVFTRGLDGTPVDPEIDMNSLAELQRAVDKA